MSRILVVGGGSAGVGAAWRAARMGGEVLLAEAGPILGGTSTLGGVHNWEPGIASPGLNRELYERLRRRPLSVGCARTLRGGTITSRMGLSCVIDGLDYDQTLRRAGISKVSRVHFEPMAMHLAMWDALSEVGVKIMLHTALIGIARDGERITGAVIQDIATGEHTTLDFDAFIDCTGDAVACRMAGAPVRFGEDAESDYGEPSAPEARGGTVNGVSLIFRTTPHGASTVREAPDWARDAGAQAWLDTNPPSSHVTIYPNGDRCYNPCPLMEGAEYWAMPAHERMRACAARVWLYWDWLKKECDGHAGFRLKEIAPRVGVRESWRAETLRTLTEMDVRTGLVDGDSIALSDHALDTHGRVSKKGSNLCELDKPYGVPLGSLIIPSYENLLVAGRCAGFSHIAASSCRLSRVMMDLGEAAGAAAALGGDMREIKVESVRAALDFDKYLEWMERVYPKIGAEGAG